MYRVGAINISAGLKQVYINTIKVRSAAIGMQQSCRPFLNLTIDRKPTTNPLPMIPGVPSQPTPSLRHGPYLPSPTLPHRLLILLNFPRNINIQILIPDMQPIIIAMEWAAILRACMVWSYHDLSPHHPLPFSSGGGLVHDTVLLGGVGGWGREFDLKRLLCCISDWMWMSF